MSQEITFSEFDLIVSKTDLKGYINYCNQSFIDISGYTIEELLQKPHNILRHPDMPKTAFQIVWNTIKKQEEWSGLVKNKTKKGDYYWVYAHISPVFEDNAHVGYLSVRRKPTKVEIEKYSTLYNSILKDEKGFK